MTPLLAVPNFSEGRDAATLAALEQAAAGARVLDRHADSDHNRSVLTLAGEPGTLAEVVLAMAEVALARIDVRAHNGVHPTVGAIDVAPIVHLDQRRRGAACAEALVLADLLGERGLPVFLYGALGNGRTRADVRRGGLPQLAHRVTNGELLPDFGPRRLHATAGAVLVAARPPLVAFNLLLADSVSLARAKEIAASIREGGARGLPGVRALGLWLEHRGRAQVSTNVEDVSLTRLADVVAAVAELAPVAEAEQVGLAPASAYDGFPDALPASGRRTIEDALASARRK